MPDTWSISDYWREISGYVVLGIGGWVTWTHKILLRHENEIKILQSRVAFMDDIKADIREIRENQNRIMEMLAHRAEVLNV